jgi:hypothetical protein
MIFQTEHFSGAARRRCEIDTLQTKNTEEIEEIWGNGLVETSTPPSDPPMPASPAGPSSLSFARTFGTTMQLTILDGQR